MLYFTGVVIAVHVSDVPTTCATSVSHAHSASTGVV